MFLDQEVQDIRDLAKKAKDQTKTQLNALVNFASKNSLEELLMEIDARGKDGKVTGNFKNGLCEKLRSLDVAHHQSFAASEKRALFIKYIIRLTDFNPGYPPRR